MIEMPVVKAEAAAAVDTRVPHRQLTVKIRNCPNPGSAGILAGVNRQKREENHAGKDAGAPRVADKLYLSAVPTAS